MHGGVQGAACYGGAKKELGMLNPGLREGGGQGINTFDMMWYEQPVPDKLASNVDNVFLFFKLMTVMDFDYDVDEAPTDTDYVNANLSSILSYAHDDVQPTYIVDSHANYTSDSNLIPYDQYVKDNAVLVVQIDNSLTVELATYKEQVELYERRARSVNLLQQCLAANVDRLALMSNVSHQQYYSQSSTTLPSTHVQLVMMELITELGMQIPVKQGRLSVTTAMENGVVLDEEQLLFLEGGHDNSVDEDVDEPPTMFMANLSSVDLVYDEASSSYDSDILSEVHDHDNYRDTVCEHHEVHEMHDDVQPNCIVDSDAEYAGDSNMILYDQYMKDNAEPVVQNSVSSVPNDVYMMIINEMHEQTSQCVLGKHRTK
ncbi:hypothetical protein Tco_0921612 [Tanacetum coccineum]